MKIIVTLGVKTLDEVPNELAKCAFKKQIGLAQNETVKMEVKPMKLIRATLLCIESKIDYSVDFI